MPAALRLHLTDDERAEVAQRFETTRDAETRLRYQMVLLAADGYTAPQIAPVVRRSAATVERVVHRYQEDGAAGVPHRRRPGRPAAVPPAWEAELRRVIELDPHTVGVDSAGHPVVGRPRLKRENERRARHLRLSQIIGDVVVHFSAACSPGSTGLPCM